MPDLETLQQEINFKAVKSSGPGGQHVNKTASKVVASLDIPNSRAFNEEEKSLLLNKLSSRLSKEGILNLESSSSRSQHKNKDIVIDRMLDLIRGALKKSKPRKKTKPSKASKLKRLREKKMRSEKKDQRQKPNL